MSPRAPMIMGSGAAGRAGRAGGSERVSGFFLPGLPAPPALPGLLREARLADLGRDEQVRLVPHELVLAVHRQLVVLPHEDGAHGTGFLAVAAEDAARLVNLIDRRVARAGLDAAVVLRRLEVDGIRRAGDGTQAAGNALLEAVLVAHQHLFSPILREHRKLLVGVVDCNWLAEE